MVISPDSEDEVRVVRACIDLGLTIIPRGGGTGYTGGAVPLHGVGRHQYRKARNAGQCRATRAPRDLHGADGACGAGVVTRRVSEWPKNTFVFAVDPTSQDASCIGGHIAKNAGGKKAVLWGTTLDNLVSWRLVTPDGDWMEVERLDHNLGKIHEQEEVRFRISAISGRQNKVLNRGYYDTGRGLSQGGLGKDVTDKFLAGCPRSRKRAVMVS